ncbi:MAG TPA: protease inhibitor I42 family protein [Methanocorpusculum sp.]|nr:protease inhibitor I42 family protein [Methanocorpusculum sp.]
MTTMKNAKRTKLLTAGLLTAAVLVLAVVSAGCVSAPQNQGEQNIDFLSLETSVLVNVEKTGTTYNIGDTAELLFPGNPSRGIVWEVAECPDGITIEEGLFIPADPQNPDGSGTQTFIITALKEGDHDFVLVNPAVDGTYAASMQVSKTGDEPMNYAAERQCHPHRSGICNLHRRKAIRRIHLGNTKNRRAPHLRTGIHPRW